jgi:hypothetical protein
MDPTIRPANVAVLFKLQSAEGTPAVPDPTVDAIPVEADSITYNTPWTQEASNEATGSLVAGAPLIIGQAAVFSFKSRIKGAGNNVDYTSTLKPPLHQVLQATGRRGQFTATIATALATAGTTTQATLAAGFPATAKALLGTVLLIGAGTGQGFAPAVIDYSAGRVATFAEALPSAIDNTSSIALPACWTYAPTSPSDATARATDQPCGTCYIYEDGTLYQFVDCRATLALDGKNARPGYAMFNFSGIFAGKTDAAVPTNLVVAGHSAPVLVQGSGKSPASSMNGKPLAISTWSTDPGSQLETPDDPNTNYGFGASQVVDRAQMIKVDPLATLVANRDTVTDIGNGTTMTVVLRHGSVKGNRWALIAPLAQPVSDDPSTRGKLRSENISLQCRSTGRDAVTRDSDVILCFY